MNKDWRPVGGVIVKVLACLVFRDGSEQLPMSLHVLFTLVISLNRLVNNFGTAVYSTTKFFSEPN